MGEPLTEEDVEQIVDARVERLLDAFIAALRKRAGQEDPPDDAERTRTGNGAV